MEILKPNKMAGGLLDFTFTSSKSNSSYLDRLSSKEGTRRRKVNMSVPLIDSPNPMLRSIPFNTSAIRTQKISALLSKYTNNYIKDVRDASPLGNIYQLPFVIQGINLAELAAYTIDVTSSGSISVQSNLFRSHGSGEGVLPLYSPFLTINDDGTSVDFLKDITPSEGDTGLVDPVFNPSKPFHTDFNEESFAEAELFDNYNENYAYWQRFANQCKVYSDGRKRPGSVVYDIFLLLTFSTTMYAREWQYEMYQERANKDGQMRPFLSDSIVRMLAHFLTELYASISRKFKKIENLTRLSIPVDDLVAAIIAFFATPTFTGVNSGRYFYSDNEGTSKVLTIIGEDPIVTLDSMTVIVPADMTDYKTKYRRLANTHVKIQAYLPYTSIAGDVYAIVQAPTADRAGVYAKYDLSDNTIIAYIQDTIDFSDCKIETMADGNQCLSKTIEADENNPITLVLDAFIAVECAMLNQEDILDFNPSSFYYRPISHELANYHIDTGTGNVVSYIFSGSGMSRDGNDVSWTVGGKMVAMGNLEYDGMDQDPTLLTDVYGRGVKIESSGVSISRYHSIDNGQLGVGDIWYKQEFVFDLYDVLKTKFHQMTSEFNVSSSFSADMTRDTDFVRVYIVPIIDITDSAEEIWNSSHPYISVRDATDNNKLFTFLHDNWPVQSGGRLYASARLIAIFRSRKTSEENVIEWPIYGSSIAYVGYIPGSTSQIKGYAVTDDDKGYVHCYDVYADDGGGDAQWLRLSYAGVKLFSSSSSNDGKVLKCTRDESYFKFVAPKNAFSLMTMQSTSAPGAPESNLARITKVKIDISQADPVPALIMSSCSSMFSRELNMFVGSTETPVCRATGYFDITGDWDDPQYSFQMADNAIASVFNESALRSLTGARKIDPDKIAELLADLQRQPYDITNPGSTFGADIDPVLLRQTLKQSKEKRAIRVLNNFLGIFDAVALDSVNGVNLDTANEETYINAVYDVPVKIDRELVSEDPVLGEAAIYDPVSRDYTVPFGSMFKNVKFEHTLVDTSQYDSKTVQYFSEMTLPDIVATYNLLSDRLMELNDNGEEIPIDLTAKLNLAADAIKATKEQLANEFSSLNADAALMSLEEALDSVENDFDTVTDITAEQLTLSINSITDSVLANAQYVNDEMINTSEKMSAMQSELSALVENSTSKMKSGAEQVKIKATTHYHNLLAEIQAGEASSQSPFSIASLNDMLVNSSSGLAQFLGKATGLLGGDKTYLGWQDSTAFTPTSTISALVGVAGSGLGAAISMAFKLLGRVSSGLSEATRKFLTSAFKDGVSYHMRSSGYSTLGLQAATYIFDRSIVSDPNSELYWLFANAPRLDGSNSAYYVSQVGPLLVIIQDYSSDQIMVTVNPILFHGDNLKVQKNDYLLMDAEADSVIYALKAYNALNERLLELGLIDFYVELNIPNRQYLLKDLLAKAKGKSAAATGFWKGLIIGAGVAAGIVLCATGYGSVAGVALIAAATAVGSACVGPVVDQSKIERLTEDATYSNGLIMAADLASLWTNSIPPSVPKQMVTILSALSNVEMDHPIIESDRIRGSLVHAGDGLVIDVAAYGYKSYYDGRETSTLGFIPFVGMSGAPTFQITLVTDRERYIKQTAAILATAVAVGGLAFAATKSTIAKYKQRKAYKLQADQWATPNPSKSDYMKSVLDANGKPVLGDDGQPIMALDTNAYNAAASDYKKTQFNLAKKITRLQGSANVPGANNAGNAVTPLLNVIATGDPTVDSNQINQQILKRIG